MALRITDACFGCGVCEAACPQRAITQGESFAVVYVIDPLACNDCMECVPVCPVYAIVPDPEWAVCHGRGCPLASSRYAGWECSEGEPRCPACGAMMWRPPGDDWVCSACRTPGGSRGARCPKTERARRIGVAGSA
ncbi:MAG: 4Fe-4S binding protein [Acidimicrobiia bacterium]|nr:4Fe-4S binding protein [Acidimicrobiia bacterium]MCL4293503.1 4Fe-4S binding protein [Acidimicrobiia bacterium]